MSPFFSIPGTGFPGCHNGVPLKCTLRPAAHFLRVFRPRSFTHGCHWPAVLPGKDGTAALACCWRAARGDGFQSGWSQELPCRPHGLPFWPTRARGRRDPPLREGRLFRVAGRKASVVGNGCLRSPGLFMLPGRLVVRTRCQGAAPLGGPFTFLTGSSHCRSSQRPPATSSATAAMPLRVPITRGKKAPPLCVARGRDGALPGCWWKVSRQVLALDCHQASRWLMALSL